MLTHAPHAAETPIVGLAAPLRPAAAPRALPRTIPAAFDPRACAAWAAVEGLAPGDAVALMMREPAEAASLGLGLARAGVRATSLDPGLRGAALASALTATGAGLAVVDSALAEAYAGVMGRLDAYPAVWWNGPGADFCRLDRALAEYAVPAAR
ncbi:AMP-dependent synthetase [Methylobacterium sp. NEAU 140]|uniref:AMP-dependent synthetase n=1 Tax=Methylobacterium sp. NEAU 140 TaxID=3064945 RepID=UPI00273771E0|nr:AMP-dependent synthetase [Methylobacterium sp. NEAU 140]MDP4023165.1 AMP-dependent synthetase [Methylobacterium sp. NEAU 140]